MNGVGVADNAGRGVDGDGDWWWGEDIPVVISLVIAIIRKGLVRITVGRRWGRGEIGEDFVRLMEQGVGWHHDECVFEVMRAATVVGKAKFRLEGEVWQGQDTELLQSMVPLDA